MNKAIVLSLLSVFFALPAAAAVSSASSVTLQVGQPLARFELLTNSSRLYVRYQVKGEQRLPLDIWHREVKLERRDGKQLVHIVWRWDSDGEQKFSRTEDFWFEPNTFRPLTVERRLTQNGAASLGGYRFLPDRIVGMKELEGNGRKDFLQLAKVTPYNFETDMELLQTLPLKTGYEVNIPFYEAGPAQDEPKLYTFRVVGEGKIDSPDGRPIDCWVVGTESSDPQWGPTRMWFSKETQVMIREQTTLKDGTIFVKSLLTTDVPA
jgi:hypothetical protein